MNSYYLCNQMRIHNIIKWPILPIVALFVFLNGYGHFLLHALSGHEDTTHHFVHEKGVQYFESEHIHCDILDFFLSPVTPSDRVEITFFQWQFDYKYILNDSPILWNHLTLHFNKDPPHLI